MDARRDVEIPARSSLTIRDCELWGAFFDTTYAYRFGPPSHEATFAGLAGAGGEMFAEAWHFPLGRSAALFQPALSAEAFFDAEGCGLRVRSDRLAQSARIEDRTLTPLDNWMHLAPGEEKVVRFVERDGRPAGRIAALGAPALSYGPLSVSWRDMT
jgi:beta-mannosidase